MVNLHLRYMSSLCDRVISIAQDYGMDVVVVAVDPAGRMIAMQRADRAGYAAIEAARRKAVTAAVMRTPTRVVAEMTSQDQIAARALAASDDMLAVPGGYPVIKDGVTYGGIGVAGGHYSEDEMIIARAMGHEAAAPAPTPTHAI
jgi:uncharacterized protein GlcG (DUF336 family)